MSLETKWEKDLEVARNFNAAKSHQDALGILQQYANKHPEGKTTAAKVIIGNFLRENITMLDDEKVVELLQKTQSTKMFNAFKSTKVQSKEIIEQIKHLRAELGVRGFTPPRIVFSTNQELDALELFSPSKAKGWGISLATPENGVKETFVNHDFPTEQKDRSISHRLSDNGTLVYSKEAGFEKLTQYTTNKDNGPIIDVLMRWGQEQNPKSSRPKQILLLPKCDSGGIPDPESLKFAMQMGKELRKTFGDKAFTPEAVVSMHPVISEMLESAVTEVLGVNTRQSVRDQSQEITIVKGKAIPAGVYTPEARRVLILAKDEMQGLAARRDTDTQMASAKSTDTKPLLGKGSSRGIGM